MTVVAWCTSAFTMPLNFDIAESTFTVGALMSTFGVVTLNLVPAWIAKPLESSLALELSEIRHDLQKGLIALERGAPLEAVLWEWRFGLDAHWGNHLVNALRAVHWQQAW